MFSPVVFEQTIFTSKIPFETGYKSSLFIRAKDAYFVILRKCLSMNQAQPKHCQPIGFLLARDKDVSLSIHVFAAKLCNTIYECRIATCQPC